MAQTATNVSLNTLFGRVLWIHSILNALQLSEDHLDYIQQLIDECVSSQNPMSQTSIPDLLVLLARGDYSTAFLHPSMSPLLNITHNVVTEQLQDKSLNLHQISLSSLLSQAFENWLYLDLDDTSDNILSSDNTSSLYKWEEKGYLLIIFAITSLYLFTQLNYAGVPFILPFTEQQYNNFANNDKLISSDDNSSLSLELYNYNIFQLLFSQSQPNIIGNNIPQTTLLEKIQSQKNDSYKDVLYRHYNVEKMTLFLSALKLNGEDTYQCLYYPLFIIISRSILSFENVFLPLFSAYRNSKGISTDTEDLLQLYMPSTRSVFGEITSNFLHKELKTPINSALLSIQSIKPGSKALSHLFFPSLISFMIRALKCQTDLLLASTTTICVEFYSLIVTQQLTHGLLTSNTSCVQGLQPICNQFSCISYEKYIDKFSSDQTYQLFESIPQILYNSFDYIRQLYIIDLTYGENLKNVPFMSFLQFLFNNFLMPCSISSSSTTTSALVKKNPNALISQQQQTLESLSEHLYAGKSPLMSQHTHVFYRPQPLYPINNAIDDMNTLSPMLYSHIYASIALELSSISQHIYAIQLSFLLLSTAKIFIGNVCHVGGVLGRRTKYQTRSFAQLQNTSYLHTKFYELLQKQTKNPLPSLPIQISINDNANKDENNYINDFYKKKLQDKYSILRHIEDSPISYYLAHDTNNTNHITSPRPVVVDALEEYKKNHPSESSDEINTTPVVEDKDALYTGVINTAYRIEPRIATFSIKNVITDDNIAVVTKEEKKENNSVDLCVTNAGYLEDVPIDHVDDVYLTYMLPDDENAALNDKDRDEQNDFSNIEKLDMDDAKGSVTYMLFRAGEKGMIIQGTSDDILDNEQSSTTNSLPPQSIYQKQIMDTMSSILIMSVVSYLHNTTPLHNDILQQEQNAYVNSIFSHKFTQSNCPTNHSDNFIVYNSYPSLLSFNELSLPYGVMEQALFYRSILEYANNHTQIRAISQIEVIANVFIHNEAQFRRCHFLPSSISELNTIFPTYGLKSDGYDPLIQKVRPYNAPLVSMWYERHSQLRSLPYHTFSTQYPDACQYGIARGLRVYNRFRMNKIFTANPMPWWVLLRLCGDICKKTGYTGNALMCYLNVQLWTEVIQLLIEMGRNGDATKVLKKVLGIPLSKQPAITHEPNTTDDTNSKKLRLDDTYLDDIDVDGDGDDDDDDNTATANDVSNNNNTISQLIDNDFSEEEINSLLEAETTTATTMVPLSGAAAADADKTLSDTPVDDANNIDEDIDEMEGSLMNFIIKTMKTSFHVITTKKAKTRIGLGSTEYILYHMLAQSTNDPQYWIKSWELSGESYAPPQRSLAKYYAVHKRDQDAYYCYQNALHLNSNDHQAWYECGVVALRLGWFHKAIPCFANSLRLKPDTNEGWNNLAACHMYVGNIASAYHALSQCLQRYTNSWKVWENYLQCTMHLRHFSDSLNAIEHLAGLKDKIDPLTLLPIEYTTKRSRLHVFALYQIWSKYIKKELSKEVLLYIHNKMEIVGNDTNNTDYVETPHHPGDDSADLISLSSQSSDNDDIMSYSSLPSLECDTLSNISEKDNDKNDDLQTIIDQSPNQCTLCVQTNVKGLPIHMLFPLSTKFQKAAQGILQNITGNESKEQQFGGRMRGGGDDVSDHHHNDDSLTLKNKNNDSDDDDDDDDDDEQQQQQQQKDELDNVFEILSHSAKGQRAILQYCVGLSHEYIAIQGATEELKSASVCYEDSIAQLLRFETLLYDISYAPIMTFFIQLLNHMQRIAESIDIYHAKYAPEGIATMDRSECTSNDMFILYCDRMITILNKNATNETMIAYIKEYINQINNVKQSSVDASKYIDSLFQSPLSVPETNDTPSSDAYYDNYYY